MDDGNCELKIKSAEKLDAGVYMCKVHNEYGSKQTECQLQVKGNMLITSSFSQSLSEYSAI